MHIELFEIGDGYYTWVLKEGKYVLAASRMQKYELVHTEARQIAERFGLFLKTEAQGEAGEPDIDFDEDIIGDAVEFGLVPVLPTLQAQGGADVSSQPQPPEVFSAPAVLSQVTEPATTTSHEVPVLEELLQAVKELYGESNSTCAQMYLDWVKGAIEGVAEAQSTKALLAALVEERYRYRARLGRVQEDGNVEKSMQLAARVQAICAACNVVRAVLNKLAGKPYQIWLSRTIWRIDHTLGDRRELR